ncbi:BA14K family protein [Jiella sp. MQZ9-1]|uniref:Lectin-like protein BA14k n=1 Tax=Jiella flava TaxID=2816857 RepID=A0A939FUJ5_9HYPH|nr:BA14K family protein [Jiella flava]MBO0661797.1 BA14K family protein [Jiella flava]MCD2470438.1 BA14K family protein [Jiella flava]
MQKFIVATAASAVLATSLIGASTLSASADPYWHHRHHHHDSGAAIAAGIGGLAVGALIGSAVASDDYDAPPPPPPVYYRPERVERVYRVEHVYDEPAPRRVYYGDHVTVCAETYRSYDPDTDTFVGYDGYRHRCDL